MRLDASGETSACPKEIFYGPGVFVPQPTTDDKLDQPIGPIVIRGVFFAKRLGVVKTERKKTGCIPRNGILSR